MAELWDPNHVRDAREEAQDLSYRDEPDEELDRRERPGEGIVRPKGDAVNEDRNAEQAVASGEPIDEVTARTVAGWWHSGQGSALYAFSSSGHIDREWLTVELDRCRRHADPGQEHELDALTDYLKGEA